MKLYNDIPILVHRLYFQ